MKKYFDDPAYDAAFERCISLMTDMMVKYGPDVLQVCRQQILDTARFPDYFSAQNKDDLLRRLPAYQAGCARFRPAG